MTSSSSAKARKRRTRLQIVKTWTEQNGLTLHPEKTKVVDCHQPEQGFTFLSYHFQGGRRWISDRSKKKLRDKVRAKTKRGRSGSMSEIVKELNTIVRGWFNYFKHAFRIEYKRIDGFIRRRLRAILLRRNKKRGRGKSINAHRQWPNAC